MRILQVLELSTNEEAVAALPYGAEEVVLKGLLYVFLVMTVCNGVFHLITGLDKVSYYGGSNTQGRRGLNGLLKCQL